jgi:hypothetical protein
MEQQWQQQQQAQQQQQIASQLEQQFDALQREHGELDRDVIERFAGPYVSEDPQNAMKRAFEDMQKFRAGIEQQLLRSKMGGPGVPQSGGPANPAEPVPTSLKDAQQAFIERRQAASSM